MKSYVKTRAHELVAVLELFVRSLSEGETVYQTARENLVREVATLLEAIYESSDDDY